MAIESGQLDGNLGLSGEALLVQQSGHIRGLFILASLGCSHAPE